MGRPASGLKSCVARPLYFLLWGIPHKEKIRCLAMQNYFGLAVGYTGKVHFVLALCFIILLIVEPHMNEYSYRKSYNIII